MPNQYATIVFPNGRVVQFRMRDAHFPRFKASLVVPSNRFGDELVVEFMKLHPDIDYDDCDGDGLARFLQFMMS